MQLVPTSVFPKSSGLTTITGLSGNDPSSCVVLCDKPLITIHPNDARCNAHVLGLPLEQFIALVRSANQAYEIIKDLGPFYGKEEIKEPTFRTTSRPVYLPLTAKNRLNYLGEDLLYLGRALKKLPPQYRGFLPHGLDSKVPFPLRIDTILDENGILHMNELECSDGASALMMAAQVAYGLQLLEDSTAAHLARALHTTYPSPKEGTVIRIALIKVIENNPYIPNTMRLIDFVREISRDTIFIELLNEEEIRSPGGRRPIWSIYNAVINEAPLSPLELVVLGIQQEQLILAGDYHSMGNKALLAMIFDQSLISFWNETLGTDRILRLRGALIPTSFIRSNDEFDVARSQNKVVKVAWTENGTEYIECSRGVALPEGDIEQSSEERWQSLRDLLHRGATIIAQDYIRPMRITSFLRKKGSSLERVKWYNRVCAKYVCNGDPNAKDPPSVSMTSLEVTLGPDVIPSGRKCAFTAGTFES